MSETALQKYELTPEHVAVKAKDYLSLKIVIDDKESYAELKKAKSVLVKIRTGTDARRKEINEKHQAIIKENNKAASMLLDPAAPAETHVKAEIKKQDDHDEAIADEKRQKEIDRVNSIQEKITEMRNAVAFIDLKTSSEIEDIITIVDSFEISLEAYQEFAQAGETTKDEVLAGLKLAWNNKLKQEQEDAARKAENERLEKIRLEQEKKDEEIRAAQAKIKDDQDAAAAKIEAAQDKIDEENRKLQVAKDFIESEKKAEQDRKDYEEFKKKTKEDARIQAEKDAEVKAFLEDWERVVNERIAVGEKARQESLKPDKEKLIAFGNKILSVFAPKLSDSEAQEILTDFAGNLSLMVNTLKRDATNL